MVVGPARGKTQIDKQASNTARMEGPWQLLAIPSAVVYHSLPQDNIVLLP